MLASVAPQELLLIESCLLPSWQKRGFRNLSPAQLDLPARRVARWQVDCGGSPFLFSVPLIPPCPSDPRFVGEEPPKSQRLGWAPCSGVGVPARWVPDSARMRSGVLQQLRSSSSSDVLAFNAESRLFLSPPVSCVPHTLTHMHTASPSHPPVPGFVMGLGDSPSGKQLLHPKPVRLLRVGCAMLQELPSTFWGS